MIVCIAYAIYVYKLHLLCCFPDKDRCTLVSQCSHYHTQKQQTFQCIHDFAPVDILDCIWKEKVNAMDMSTCTLWAKIAVDIDNINK